MFVNDNIEKKYPASMSYGLDRNIVRPANKRSQRSINIIQRIKLINVHTPYPPKILITPIRGSKTYLICQRQHLKEIFRLYFLRTRHQSCEAIHWALTKINQDHSMNKLKNVHTPYPPKILITSIKGIKNILTCHSFSFIIKLTQKPTNFNPYQIISLMQQLTHTPMENKSTKIHENQQDIHDINIQHNKGMIIENTLKYKLNSQQKTNASWLVTKTTAILKTPNPKSEKPI